jgi:5-methylcytosine-specific restriction enzyme subunit McrC
VPATTSIVENRWYPVDSLFRSQQAAKSWDVARQRIYKTAEDVKRTLGLRSAPFAVEDQNGIWRFRATGIAGAVHLLGTTVQVIPKFLAGHPDSSDWDLSLLAIVRRARRSHFTYTPVHRLGLRRATFIDHVALAFIDCLKKAGPFDPIRVYRTVEESTPVLRGRISMSRQIGSVLKGGYKLECDIDYLDADNAFNQLLHWAVDRFCDLASDPRLRSLVATSRQYLPTIDGRAKIPQRLPIFAPPQYGHFSDALDLACQLAAGFTHSQGNGGNDGYGFLLNMEKIFEAFVERTLGRVAGSQPAWVAKAQETRMYAVANRSGLKSYFTRPDNVLYVGGAPSLLVDAKYKGFSESEVKSKLPENADLYQLFASLLAHRCTRGLLVYPRMGDEPSSLSDGLASWTIEQSGTLVKIAAVTLDLVHLNKNSSFLQLDNEFQSAVRSAMQ